MAKTAHGYFEPKNPEKYVGSYPITYRSSWELSLMNVLDAHPNILNWASESIRIPYMHPFKGKWCTYIPDFLITYIDKNNKKRVEVIEIKPLKETLVEFAKSKKDKEALAINMAKWQAAIEWCTQRHINFKVMTEKDLYL